MSQHISLHSTYRKKTYQEVPNQLASARAIVLTNCPMRLSIRRCLVPTRHSSSLRNTPARSSTYCHKCQENCHGRPGRWGWPAGDTRRTEHNNGLTCVPARTAKDGARRRPCIDYRRRRLMSPRCFIHFSFQLLWSPVVTACSVHSVIFYRLSF
jgi:hypothetical protein